MEQESDGILFHVEGWFEGDIEADSREEAEAKEAMIPKGWYEISDYGDASYVIDDPIVGWQDLPDPWE